MQLFFLLAVTAVGVVRVVGVAVGVAVGVVVGAVGLIRVVGIAVLILIVVLRIHGYSSKCFYGCSAWLVCVKS